MRRGARTSVGGAATFGAVVAVGAWLRTRPAPADEPVVEPADLSGAAIPLDRPRASLGATPDAHLVARPDEPPWVRALAGWTPPAPRTRLGRVLAYVWAAPATFGGLVVGLLTLRRPRVRDGVLLFADAGGLPGALLARRRFAATTLGHVVIARADPSPVLMAHELAHTRQAERLGPLMGPLYWYLLARYGYPRHPMERAARIAGRRARGA